MSNHWIELFCPRPQARERLFCFPHAGGAAQIFRSWGEHLPASFEVCPIQLPGRWRRLREPPLRRMKLLVRAALEGLRPWLDRPFAFFGHSLGALVAFELARELRRAGEPQPRHLFVSARSNPEVRPRHRQVHFLPDQQLISQVCALYDGIPQEVLANPDLLELLLPALRADLEVYETYLFEPEDPLDCSISAVGGTEDPSIDEEDLRGWRRQTSSSFALRMFPGGHFFLNDAQPDLLALLAAQLGLQSELEGERRLKAPSEG